MHDMHFSPDLAKAIRERLDLNRVEASRLVGLSRQGLINIEDGDSVPSVATLARMASAYRAEPGDFFTEKDATERVAEAPLNDTRPATTASRR